MRNLAILILVVVTQGQAAPFAKYRAILSAPKEAARLEKASADQILEIRKLLGTSERTYPALKVPAINKGSKKTASGIIKSTLGPTAEKLRREEEEGNPAVFDPSKFDFELDKDRLDSRYAFCEKHLGKEYPRVVKELLYEHIQSAKVPGGFGGEIQLIAQVKGIVPESVLAKLGEIESIDFIDGKILKIYFQPAGEKPFPVSASLLSTVRTLRDKYFIIVLECIRHHVATVAADEKAKDKDYHGIAQYLLPALNERVKEAGKIHERLGTLTRAEFDGLLDFFLTLQLGDVPSAEEMETPDDPSAWKIGASPSFPAYVFKQTALTVEVRNRWLSGRASALLRGDKNAVSATEKEAAAVMAPVEEMLADYQFYRLAQDQLDQLQDFLVEAKEREVVDQKILKGMK